MLIAKSLLQTIDSNLPLLAKILDLIVRGIMFISLKKFCNGWRKRKRKKKQEIPALELSKFIYSHIWIAAFFQANALYRMDSKHWSIADAVGLSWALNASPGSTAGKMLA